MSDCPICRQWLAPELDATLPHLLYLLESALQHAEDKVLRNYPCVDLRRAVELVRAHQAKENNK